MWIENKHVKKTKFSSVHVNGSTILVPKEHSVFGGQQREAVCAVLQNSLIKNAQEKKLEGRELSTLPTRGCSQPKTF